MSLGSDATRLFGERDECLFDQGDNPRRRRFEFGGGSGLEQQGPPARLCASGWMSGRRGGQGLRLTPVPASARQLRPHTEEARLERGELALTRQGLPAVKRLGGFRVLLSRETDHGEVVPQLDDGTIPAERFKELKTLPRI